MTFDPRFYDDQYLGRPIPDDPDAVSVGFPKFWHNVAYEEGQLAGAMKSGYPRFFIHPAVQKLREKYQVDAQDDEIAWVFPSTKVADACSDFIGGGRVVETDGIAVLYVPDDGKNKKAKEFWQHTGLIVSSRQARDILDGRAPVETDAPQKLKEMIAGHHGVNAGDVFVFPTGMAAIFRAYQAVTCGRDDQTIQLGFPYVDTLKIQEKFGKGRYVAYNLPDDLKEVERLVKQGDVKAVICEIPGNPLLRTVDLKALSAILKTHNVPLLVDDTLGTPFDIDVKPYADVIVTSLTKTFSGQGNVMGGSVVLNPESPHYQQIKQRVGETESLLYGRDADVLVDNGKGFAELAKVSNANAERLHQFLSNHKAVKTVYYTKGDPAYEDLKKDDGGYGSLLSIELHDPDFDVKGQSNTSEFYDHLEVAKGPSLGMVHTLVCPFTLLAHYGELEWAKDAPNFVPPNLIRVSVGAENYEELEGRFAVALKRAMPQPAPG